MTWLAAWTEDLIIGHYRFRVLLEIGKSRELKALVSLLHSSPLFVLLDVCLRTMSCASVRITRQIRLLSCE